MNIVAIYEKCKKSITGFSTNISLEDIRKRMVENVNLSYIITLALNDMTQIDLNLSHILVETECGQATTWDEFLDKITNVQLEAYKDTIILENKEGIKLLKVVYCNDEADLLVQYTNITTPDIRNNKSQRFALPDLVITNVNDYPINFKNCLASVNGCMLHTIFFNDELYIKDGAKCIWSLNEFHQPDIILLDTSELGGHQIIKFSDCSYVFKSTKFIDNENSSDIDVDIEVKLPESVNICEKTIAMVIGNKLYFPDEINIVSNSSFIIVPNMLGLEASLLYKQIAIDNSVPNTEIFITDLPVYEYIKKEIWKPSHTDSFIILFNNPYITVNRRKVIPELVVTRMNPHAKGGLLIQKSTKALLSFTNIEYTKSDTIYRQKQLPFYKLDIPFNEVQKGTSVLRCWHETDFKYYPSNQYELLYLNGL